MIHRFDCPESSVEGDPRYPGPLVFTWDDRAGTVQGPGAATIHALIREGWVAFGPHPRALWKIEPSSLLSRAGVAAIIGHAWCVPEALLPDYPRQPADDVPEQTTIGADGVTTLGRDQFRF